MAAHHNLGAQFDFAGIPAPLGTTPVPEGDVRFFHHTSKANVESIRQRGLLASLAHPASEDPTAVFASAGVPERDLGTHALMGGQQAFVEGHMPTSNLDVGWMDKPADLERHQSTITFRGDVPPENITAVHEPWQSAFRGLMEHPDMEREIMTDRNFARGTSPDIDKAVDATRITLAAKVMLGGKLRGYRGQ